MDDYKQKIIFILVQNGLGEIMTGLELTIQLWFVNSLTNTLAFFYLLNLFNNINRQ